uniref:Uncharacterized protein n=1 Tax=Brassica oleracea TaxID=3712 RepID=A0A3P6G5Q8_BRAOL|nr:unnamed protein product [Brassica oleracea]
MVNVSGEINALYTELNAKFENLNTHGKKLETQVVETGDTNTSKRQETFIKGKVDEALKCHVNAIDGDFKVESCMSFDSSQWCRLTPREEHPSMD